MEFCHKVKCLRFNYLCNFMFIFGQCSLVRSSEWIYSVSLILLQCLHSINGKTKWFLFSFLMDYIYFHSQHPLFKKKITFLLYLLRWAKFHLFSIHHQTKKFVVYFQDCLDKTYSSKYQKLLQEAFIYNFFQCVNINQNETAPETWKKESRWNYLELKCCIQISLLWYISEISHGF